MTEPSNQPDGLREERDAVPVRIQRQRTKGWKMPPNTVYVGRPTIWGNPFVADDPTLAVEAYRRLAQHGTKTFDIRSGGLQFADDRHPNSTHWAYAGFVERNIKSLRGKNLACWCRLDQPCHADVLLELANQPLDQQPHHARQSSEARNQVDENHRSKT